MKRVEDIEIVKIVAEYGILTVRQASILICASEQVTRRRFQRMEKADLVLRRPGMSEGSQGRPETLITIGSAGIKALKTGRNGRFAARDFQTPGFVNHQLQTNWFRVKLHELEREVPDLTVTYLSSNSPFTVDAKGNSILRSKAPIPKGGKDDRWFIPDGAFAIKSESLQKQLLFFLEVDASTESLINGKDSSIAGKISNYRCFRASDRYLRFEKMFSMNFKGFRLLFLANTTTRKQKICQVTEAMPPADFVWITDQTTLLDQGLKEAIWVRGGHIHKPLQSILGSLHTQPFQFQ